MSAGWRRRTENKAGTSVSFYLPVCLVLSFESRLRKQKSFTSVLVIKYNLDVSVDMKDLSPERKLISFSHLPVPFSLIIRNQSLPKNPGKVSFRVSAIFIR